MQIIFFDIGLLFIDFLRLNYAPYFNELAHDQKRPESFPTPTGPTRSRSSVLTASQIEIKLNDSQSY